MRILIEDVIKKFGDQTVISRLNLEVEDGEMLALLGPSGCGKSTILYTICGIYRLDGGRILFGDRDVSCLPSQKRNVGVVFQSYALYPHLDVYKNISFPLDIRGDSDASIKKKVFEIAGLLQIGDLLKRLPSQLSGGQQQRVALARALVRKPDILLLDEPLANLDARLRLEMRSEIRRLQQETGITAILVTHDQVEAMSICDRIAIMKEGKIHQISAPNVMYQQPANTFVAGFLGNPPIVFVEGQVEAGFFVRPEAGLRIEIPERLRQFPNYTRVQLGIRPEFISPRYGAQLSGTVSFIELQGRETLYDLSLDDGTVIRSIQEASEKEVVLGERVAWGVDSEKLLLFDKEGKRL